MAGELELGVHCSTFQPKPFRDPMISCPTSSSSPASMPDMCQDPMWMDDPLQVWNSMCWWESPLSPRDRSTPKKGFSGSAIPAEGHCSVSETHTAWSWAPGGWAWVVWRTLYWRPTGGTGLQHQHFWNETKGRTGLCKQVLRADLVSSWHLHLWVPGGEAGRVSALMQGVEICCVTGWDYLSFTAQQKKNRTSSFLLIQNKWSSLQTGVGGMFCFVSWTFWQFPYLFSSGLILVLFAKQRVWRGCRQSYLNKSSPPSTKQSPHPTCVDSNEMDKNCLPGKKTITPPCLILKQMEFISAAYIQKKKEMYQT